MDVAAIKQLLWESLAARSAADFVDRYAVECCKHTEAVSDCAHCNLTFLASYTRRSIEAVERLQAAVQASQWRDIETAPKDGTPILGCRPSWTHPYVFCYLNGPSIIEGWHDFNISPSGRRPHDLTHWMPLPAAPKDGPQTEGLTADAPSGSQRQSGERR